MKIAVAQLNYHIGHFEGNLAKMLLAVKKAKNEKADIICFSELSTCGYPPRDFLEFDDFVDLSLASIEQLRGAADGIAIIVGSPSRNPVIEGKDLYNSVYFLADQKIVHVQHKTLLPTYDIFDEYRHFEPATEHKIVHFKGRKIALTICEDLWNIGNENPRYTICPMDQMMAFEPDIMINVSASPFSYNQSQERLGILKANVERYGLPIFYVNHVGAQTEVIFDGGSVVMSPNGEVFEELPYFEESFRVYQLDDVLEGRQSTMQDQGKIAKIHDAIVLGIQDYFGKLGFQKAVVGLSGGIDSAVTAALAVRALGPDNVRVILMPSEFSSEHSISDAKELANNLQIKSDLIPIHSLYSEFNAVLAPYFIGTEFNVTEENIQARIRGLILMAFSNKFGYILLNTSNKSEMAVGYGTLYGDLCGGLSVIADVYKTEVYALAKFINKEKEIIPLNSIEKPPSAELRPDQKDSDSLPDYADLDEILYQYIEKERGPDEIIKLGFDESLVKRILRLVNINEFKRYQTAPALRVSSKAFGMGRRIPIVGKYLS